MSNYGWVGKHTDELLQAVGMINHAVALLSSDDRRSGMKLKIRLIWRNAMTDSNGVVAEYVYKTDDIILPEDAQAFQFPDTEKYGWMPELVGGEWIKEDKE